MTRSNDRVCVVCDLREYARPNSIQVWSHGKKAMVSLPRKLIWIESGMDLPAKWIAVTMPRWLASREKLWSHDGSIPGLYEMDDQDSLRAAMSLARIHNRYTLLPGQQFAPSGGDADGARMRRT